MKPVSSNTPRPAERIRRVAVAGQEAGVGRRVVVLQQLEQEAEAAAAAADRLVREALAAVVVDRAVPQLGQIQYGMRPDSTDGAWSWIQAAADPGGRGVALGGLGRASARRRAPPCSPCRRP